jgi:hypothetical protein
MRTPREPRACEHTEQSHSENQSCARQAAALFLYTVFTPSSLDWQKLS